MKVGTYLIGAFLRVASALPLGFHYAWSGLLSWLAKDLVHYRRELVMMNLARSFPHAKYKELKNISNLFYKHFGEILAEAIWFGGCRNPQRLRDRHLVEILNSEVLEDAYNDSPGVIILDSHCGNWELLGGYENYDYRRDFIHNLDRNSFVVIYKPLSNKVWNEVMRMNRCAPVNKGMHEGYISSNEILRYALTHRNEKKIYLFPTDQCPYSNSTVDETVDFMHQDTKTMLGAASIANKFGFSVLYMNMLPVARGRYEWTFTEICRNASEHTPHEIMQRFYNLLQEDIEKTPWNYLWTHNRWKK
ncbi:MAG: lysophospholipid acyltransferase family protein [Candidatus Cryptobacteroides sp.]